MRKLIGTSLVVAALAVPLLAASPARAGLDACGNIHVEANAQCVVEVEGGCLARCEPVSFYASCAAEGYVSCQGQCELPPPIGCSGSCQGSCEAECGLNPNFSCEASCEAECTGDCSGHCSAAGDKAECEAQCKATCTGECGASCTGAPATCEGKCSGSCEGRCKAAANWNCQAECQGKLSAGCQAEMQGGCEVACKTPQGALFCDGQYIDHGGNLQTCIDALRAQLNVKVEVSSSSSLNCADGVCQGEAEASAGCSLSVANAPADGSTPYAIGLLGMLGGLLFGRYRRRK